MSAPREHTWGVWCLAQGHLSRNLGSGLEPLQLPVHFHIVVCSWTWTGHPPVPKPSLYWLSFCRRPQPVLMRLIWIFWGYFTYIINKFITLTLKLILMCLTLYFLHYWYHQKWIPEEGRAEGLEGDVPCPVASERLFACSVSKDVCYVCT